MSRNYTAAEWHALSDTERARELTKARRLLSLSALPVPQHNAFVILQRALDDYEGQLEVLKSELVKGDER